jgi:tetratricopeptide (TPR) repeat protein
MAEEDDAVSGGKAGDAAALGLAVNAGSPSQEARTYLREQTELARLQKQNLIEQNAFELSHLRWRRFNDQMKGALQIMVVALGLLIVVAIVTAMWNASHADGIVVDSFSVPPGFVAAGIAGDVIADDLTGRIGNVRDVADGNSLDNSKDVRKNRDDDVRVEIPETGVSLAQAWRYLKLWLGHERHVSGNVRVVSGGRIALTVTLDGDGPFTASGTQDDLGKLEQQAAEHIFAAVEPINVVLYYDVSRRPAEALAAAEHATTVVSDPRMLSDAYSLWSYETRDNVGDMALTALRIRRALAISPHAAAAHVEIVRTAMQESHDEEALAAARAIAGLKRDDQPEMQQGRGFDEIQNEAVFARERVTADYAQALTEQCDYCSAAELALTRAEFAALLHDAAGSRRLFAEALADGTARSALIGRGRYFADMAAGNWRTAAGDARAYGAALEAATDEAQALKDLQSRTQAVPLLAMALAQGRDFAGARAAIDPTPMDCDRCLLARGNIDAREGNWTGAAYWFALVAARSPDVPFADSEWGWMLMARGDLDGAIAKFESAHAKGPHFADPSEMWGEALIAKNRSDLALAKFAEADKYAPNWGRLHLKWGEALLWSGDKDGARKQFAVAAQLDLAPADRAALARFAR